MSDKIDAVCTQMCTHFQTCDDLPLRLARPHFRHLERLVINLLWLQRKLTPTPWMGLVQHPDVTAQVTWVVSGRRITRMYSFVVPCPSLNDRLCCQGDRMWPPRLGVEARWCSSLTPGRSWIQWQEANDSFPRNICSERRYLSQKFGLNCKENTCVYFSDRSLETFATLRNKSLLFMVGKYVVERAKKKSHQVFSANSSS